ncbi:MAG: hypothetical protein Q4C58_05745 [Eubacteriales bacterium]|nr:hypothetical protein [Eubacteriales bacterium]
MKKMGKAFAALLLVLGMSGSLVAAAAETAYQPDQMDDLTGTVWTGGDVICAQECAVMLSYRFENPDKTQEGMDALCEAIHSYAQSQGYQDYSAVDAQSKIYGVMEPQGVQSVNVLVIGADLEYGVSAAESGYSRRFAHQNEIWAALGDADGWQVVSCETQDYYMSGEEEQPCYYIELEPWYQDAEGEEGAAGAFVQKAGCSHVYEYVIVKEPSEKEDGIMARQCEKCGAVVGYQPISAIAAFLKNAEKAVKSAPQGAAVTVETDRWLCFDRAVMEAIASRPDVAVTVNYRYQHRNYTVTVPAGYDVMSLLDENGFCGFRYLDLILGGTERSE